MANNFSGLRWFVPPKRSVASGGNLIEIRAYNSSEFSDLTIVFEHYTFKLHKVVIFGQSPILRALCDGKVSTKMHIMWRRTVTEIQYRRRSNLNILQTSNIPRLMKQCSVSCMDSNTMTARSTTLLSSTSTCIELRVITSIDGYRTLRSKGSKNIPQNSGMQVNS